MIEIKQAQFLTSAINKTQWPNDCVQEFCFVGRSNVGKSTLLNLLVNQKQLARTSQKPGKTQMLNFFVINQNQFRFVDIPGYGYAQMSKHQKTKMLLMIEEYLEQRTNLKAVFLLLDFRRLPSSQDIIMFHYLSQTAKHVILIATKIDKISKNDFAKQKLLILKSLNLAANTPLILFSSTKKIGKAELLQSLSTLICKEQI